MKHPATLTNCIGCLLSFSGACIAFHASAQYSNDSWDESFGSGGLQIINQFINTAANGPSATAVDADGNFYLAGGDWNTLDGVTNTGDFSFAKWTRASGTWETFAEGANARDVNDMVVAEDGTLYVGGVWNVFPDGAGGVESAAIVKWDGSEWSGVGGGLTGNSGLPPSVRCLALDEAGNLYVGGSFSAAGGVEARSVAKWDGNSWSALGEGLESPVNTLEVAPDGSLYAGGGFGDGDLSRIAKWTGSTWEGLDKGFTSGHVNAITFDDAGMVYAGGGFPLAFGGPIGTNFITVNGVAYFDGEEWQPLGSGLNGDVRALAYTDGVLFVGGEFTATHDGQTEMNYIGAWDGSAWHALGDGVALPEVSNLFAPTVFHLHVSMSSGDSSEMDLIAAGTFGRAGEMAANNVALWNIGESGGGSGLTPGEWNETSDIGWVYAYTGDTGYGVNFGPIYVSDAPWYFFYNGMGWLYLASTVNTTLYWYSPDLGWLIQDFSSPWFTYDNGSEWVWDNFLNPSM
jgi:hypothetical protein